MKIVELTTGLFPDADRVGAAVSVLETAHEIERRDASALAPNDAAAWEEIARAVLGADLVVTL